MSRLRVFGAGIRADIVADLVKWHFSTVFRIDGFYDDNASVGPFGAPVLGTVAEGVDAVRRDPCDAFIAFGTRGTAAACSLFSELGRAGANLVSLVAPTAHVASSAVVGRNTIIMPGVFVGALVRIGHLCCLHGGSTVEHHGAVGNGVLVGPGVSTASKVKVGDFCFLGAGTNVIPERSLGDGTLLGAGSLVTRDLPANVVATGAPARVIRKTRESDEVPTHDVVERLKSTDWLGSASQ